MGKYRQNDTAEHSTSVKSGKVIESEQTAAFLLPSSGRLHGAGSTNLQAINSTLSKSMQATLQAGELEASAHSPCDIVTEHE